MDGSLYNEKLDRYGFNLPAGPRPEHRTSHHQAIHAKLATTEADRDLASALRYEAYSAVGYLGTLESRRYSDQYDLESTSRTLLLFRAGSAVASARVCALDRSAKANHHGIPAYEMFRSEIDAWLAAEAAKSKSIGEAAQSRSTGAAATGHEPRPIEVTRLSRHPAYARDIAITQALFRMIGYLILQLDGTMMLAAITTNHIPFYRRMGFTLIAEPRDYKGLDVQTALMGCSSQSHTPIPGLLSPLSALSKHDDIYQPFLDGEFVKVTEEALARRPRATRAH